MKTSKHTPGPWRVNGQTITKSDGYKVRVDSPRGAAPELLEALSATLWRFKREYQQLTDDAFGPIDDFPEVELARAAIAKATGEQP